MSWLCIADFLILLTRKRYPQTVLIVSLFIFNYVILFLFLSICLFVSLYNAELAEGRINLCFSYLDDATCQLTFFFSLQF